MSMYLYVGFRITSRELVLEINLYCDMLKQFGSWYNRKIVGTHTSSTYLCLCT